MVFIISFFSYLSTLPGVDAAGVEEAHDPGVLGRNPEDLSLGVTLVQRRATTVTEMQFKNVLFKKIFDCKMFCFKMFLFILFLYRFDIV